jgi:glycosyltransferase involved in cell wall biosynthesis
VWEETFARRIVFVPNLEWITTDDEALLQTIPLAAVLFKSRFALEKGSEIPAFRNAPVVRQVGWTSRDIANAAEAAEQRFDRFLHVRGASRLKQTGTVLQAWWKNPSFPMLEVVSTFSDGLAFPAPARIGENITVHVGELTDDALRSMQRRIGIHVIPSAVEGFGHALNEARAAASVLITTDGPPMNEFVIDGVSGFLVKVRSEGIRPFHRAISFALTTEDLAETVDRVLRHSSEELRAIGQRARSAFLEEKNRFRAEIGAFLSHIL